MNFGISEEDISLFKTITCQDDQKAIEFLSRYSDVNTAVAHYFAGEDPSANSHQPQQVSRPQQPVANTIPQPKASVADQALGDLLKLIPSLFGHQLEIPSHPQEMDSITINSGESREISPAKREIETHNQFYNYKNNANNHSENRRADVPKKKAEEEVIIIENDDDFDETEQFVLITDTDQETARNYLSRYGTLDRAVQEFFNRDTSSHSFEKPKPQPQSQPHPQQRASWKPTSNHESNGFPMEMLAATQMMEDFSISPAKPVPMSRKRNISDCRLRLHWHDYNAYVKKHMKQPATGSKSNQWPKFLGSLLVDCNLLSQSYLSMIKVGDEITFQPEEIEFGMTDIKRKKRLPNGKFTQEVVGKNCYIKSNSLMVRCIHNRGFIGYLSCDLEEVFVFLLTNKYILLDGVVVLNPSERPKNSGFEIHHKLTLQMDVFLTEEIIKNPLNAFAGYGKRGAKGKSGAVQNIEELSEEDQRKYQTLRLAKESLRKLFLMLKTKITIPTAVKFYQKVDPFQRIKNDKYVNGKMSVGQPAEIITKDFPDYYQGNNNQGELMTGSQNPFLIEDDSEEDEEQEYDDYGRKIRRGYSRFDKPKAKEEKEQESEVNPDLFTPETPISNYYVACEPPKTLKSELHIYQKQALSWMKYREGCIGRQDLFEKELEEQRVLNDLFQEMELLNESKFYFNPFNGEVSADLPEVRACKGGILADEMGLGKTVMMIALLHSHKRPSVASSGPVVDETLIKYFSFKEKKKPEITAPAVVQEEVESVATTVVKQKPISRKKLDYGDYGDDGIEEEEDEEDEMKSEDNDLRLMKKNGKRDAKKDLDFEDFFSDEDDGGFMNPGEAVKKLKTGEEKPKITISKILEDKRDDLLDLMFKDTPKKKTNSDKPRKLRREIDLEDEEEEKTAPNTIVKKSKERLVPVPSVEEKKEGSKKKVNTKPKRLAGTLIIVPLTVLSQWQGEIERHSNPNTLSVYQYYGESRKREKVEKYDVVLTTYGTLSSEYNDLKKNPSPLFQCEWFRVILDEGHTIRTRQTLMSKAACALEAENRWCLTGTPLQNKLDDVFSLLQFLGVETWGEYAWWNNYINKQKSQDESSKLIRGILKMILLRRTKKSTYLDGSNILQLPPKETNNVLVKLSPEEKAIYTKVFKGVKSVFNKLKSNGRLESEYMHILVIILRLRQICDHPSLVFSKSDLQDEEKFEQAINQFLQQDPTTDTSLVEDEEEGSRANKPNKKKIGSEFIKGNIERLKTKEFEPCSICYEDITEPAMTKCGHIFCQNCIVTSLRNSSRCPLCQKEISEEDVIAIELEDPTNSHLDPERVNSMESSKLSAVTKAAKEVASKGEKVVIFSQFLGMLDLIQKHLKEARIGYTRIDGGLAMKERVRNIESFKTDPGITVFLISLKAGATGLNLTAANHVFLVDPWWNPAVEDQAIERVYRIGQKHKVNVKRFVCKKTIEERVIQLNAQKNEMISKILQFNPLEKKQNNIQNMIYILQGFDENDNDDDDEGQENGDNNNMMIVSQK